MPKMVSMELVKETLKSVPWLDWMSAFRYLDELETFEIDPANSKWISVEHRLPEEEKEVLCYLGNSIAKAIVVSFRRHGNWYLDGFILPTVTHWMPLPEAPKEENK